MLVAFSPFVHQSLLKYTSTGLEDIVRDIMIGLRALFPP